MSIEQENYSIDIFPYTLLQKQAFRQTAKPPQTLFATARATLSAWLRCQGKQLTSLINA